MPPQSVIVSDIGTGKGSPIAETIMLLDPIIQELESKLDTCTAAMKKLAIRPWPKGLPDSHGYPVR
jgi:hypothetical protein